MVRSGADAEALSPTCGTTGKRKPNPLVKEQLSWRDNQPHFVKLKPIFYYAISAII